MKKNNKGFTLAELLIVVAIIAVLVAIAIPIFTTQLEKSREATDLANLRGAYAEGVAHLLDTPVTAAGTWDAPTYKNVQGKASQDGFQTSDMSTASLNFPTSYDGKASGKTGITISYDANGTVTGVNFK